MSKVVLLDTGILSRVAHPSDHPDERRWVERLSLGGAIVLVPDIADYELRRELLRARRLRSVRRLDGFIERTGQLHLTPAALRRAAELWASARNSGRVTAPADDLDADVIIAAEAQELSDAGHAVVVATTNVRHLAWFVDARLWSDIDPAG